MLVTSRPATVGLPLRSVTFQRPLLAFSGLASLPTSQTTPEPASPISQESQISQVLFKHGLISRLDLQSNVRLFTSSARIKKKKSSVNSQLQICSAAHFQRSKDTNFQSELNSLISYYLPFSYHRSTVHSINHRLKKFESNHCYIPVHL